MKKKIAILCSKGSIGKNLIEIIAITLISIGTLQLMRCKFRKNNDNEKIKLVDQNNFV